MILGGLLLWGTEDGVGERWHHASYDYLFRFSLRKVTNELVLVLMQSEERPPKPWDRAVHAEFINRLADEHCPLVVFDVLFQNAPDVPADVALLTALRRLEKVVLAGFQERDDHPMLPSRQPVQPAAAFLAATKTNCGIAWFQSDLDGIVREHWPPPPAEPQQSLSWKAAQLAGVTLSNVPQRRWLRYYGFDRPGIRLEYSHAMNQAAGYFSDKIVFIGNKPQSPAPDGEEDEFSTPYTRWEGEACGGVNLVVTAFLNLLNHEWLRRAAWPIEGAVVLLIGGFLGARLCRLRPVRAFWASAACALLVTLSAVALTHITNLWFPWLVVVGAQVPCALIWAWVTRPRMELSIRELLEDLPPPLAEAEAVVDSALIEAADYEVINPPFAQGSFGRVSLARNAIGQWQALKTVYEAKFGVDRTPYELEFRGISNYKPISDKHPGLLRVDFVSKPKLEGYFYYVMELADAITPGWESDPKIYKPRDLASVIRDADRHRLPIAECVRIIGLLAEVLDFLHQQGFTHRDVKPSNIIFVNGRPKLADVGLVREIRPAAEVKTWAGTVGYMPPHESPGTVEADIYALGMVLYVISTGNQPGLFPEISSTLAAMASPPEFMRLNSVILKACEPDIARRFASAAEFCAALVELQKLCEKSSSAAP